MPTMKTLAEVELRTAIHAKSRGFNVAQLRAKGLIKELPAEAAFGQGQGKGHGQPGN